MAENGKTIVDGISGVVKFLLFGVPGLIILFFAILFPDLVFNNFGTFFAIFIVLVILWWVFLGFMISKAVNARKMAKAQKAEEEHRRNLEVARAQGRAYRGEDFDKE